MCFIASALFLRSVTNSLTSKDWTEESVGKGRVEEGGKGVAIFGYTLCEADCHLHMYVGDAISA